MLVLKEIKGINILLLLLIHFVHSASLQQGQLVYFQSAYPRTCESYGNFTESNLTGRAFLSSSTLYGIIADGNSEHSHTGTAGDVVVGPVVHNAGMGTSFTTYVAQGGVVFTDVATTTDSANIPTIELLLCEVAFDNEIRVPNNTISYAIDSCGDEQSVFSEADGRYILSTSLALDSPYYYLGPTPPYANTSHNHEFVDDYFLDGFCSVQPSTYNNVTALIGNNNVTAISFTGYSDANFPNVYMLTCVTNDTSDEWDDLPFDTVMFFQRQECPFQWFPVASEYNGRIITGITNETSGNVQGGTPLSPSDTGITHNHTGLSGGLQVLGSRGLNYTATCLGPNPLAKGSITATIDHAIVESAYVNIPIISMLLCKKTTTMAPTLPTLQPTALPTYSPSVHPTTSPTSSIPTVSPVSSVPTMSPRTNTLAQGQLVYFQSTYPRTCASYGNFKESNLTGRAFISSSAFSGNISGTVGYNSTNHQHNGTLGAVSVTPISYDVDQTPGQPYKIILAQNISVSGAYTSVDNANIPTFELLLCETIANNVYSLPTGAISYATDQCGAGQSTFNESEGRYILSTNSLLPMPYYHQGPTAPYANTSHFHTASANAQIDQACVFNSNNSMVYFFNSYIELTVQVETKYEEFNIPNAYVLTCVTENIAEADDNLPIDTVMFFKLSECPELWIPINASYDGRFVIGITNGTSGTIQGGAGLGINDIGVPHSHANFIGNLVTPVSSSSSIFNQYPCPGNEVGGAYSLPSTVFPLYNGVGLSSTVPMPITSMLMCKKVYSTPLPTTVPTQLPTRPPTYLPTSTSPTSTKPSKSPSTSEPTESPTFPSPTKSPNPISQSPGSAKPTVQTTTPTVPKTSSPTYRATRIPVSNAPTASPTVQSDFLEIISWILIIVGVICMVIPIYACIYCTNDFRRRLRMKEPDSEKTK